jgi:hypothetical protein
MRTVLRPGGPHEHMGRTRPSAIGQETREGSQATKENFMPRKTTSATQRFNGRSRTPHGNHVHEMCVWPTNDHIQCLCLRRSLHVILHIFYHSPAGTSTATTTDAPYNNTGTCESSTVLTMSSVNFNSAYTPVQSEGDSSIAALCLGFARAGRKH